MKRLYDEYNVRLSKPCERDAAVVSKQPSSMLGLSDDDDDGCEQMDSIYNKIFSLRNIKIVLVS